MFDNKFVDLLSFSIPLCNVSNTYQKFVANTCKLKCAIYTGTQSYLRRYSHAHLVTLLSLVRSAVFVFVVTHVRTRHMQLLPAFFGKHPHSPARNRPCLHGLQLSPALTPNNQKTRTIPSPHISDYKIPFNFISLLTYQAIPFRFL